MNIQDNVYLHNVKEVLDEYSDIVTTVGDDGTVTLATPGQHKVTLAFVSGESLPVPPTPVRPSAPEWMTDTTNKINNLGYAEAKIGAGDSPGMLEIEVHTESGGDSRWLVLTQIDEDAVSFGLYRTVLEEIWVYASGKILHPDGTPARPEFYDSVDTISWASLLLTLALEVDNPRALKSLPYFDVSLDSYQIT